MRNFTAFDAGDFGLAKRIAKPHEYFAVNKALGRTVTAVKSNGKAGVVWRTQGSGKSAVRGVRRVHDSSREADPDPHPT